MSKIFPICFLCCLLFAVEINAQSQQIESSQTGKTVTFGNKQLRLTLDYNNKAAVTSMVINGQEVMHDSSGIISSIRTKGKTYSTLHITGTPVLKIADSTVTLSGISYGDAANTITETWTFDVSPADIMLKIDREQGSAIDAEQVALPAFTFKSMDTWEGAYQDYGGLAWFYLFNKPLDTYGVHSAASQFWNHKTSNGLTIEASSAGKKVAMDYSRTTADKLTCNIAFDERDLQPRYDSGTNRRRFIRDGNDIWAPITLKPGKTSQSIRLAYFNSNERYDRGTLAGINGEQVSAVLNTIARIGVIDKEHFGGNSWHTPYGPICLHEQYIAQMGLAVNDKAYLTGYQQTLDYYRDHAIKPDGRVWPRWAYTNEDMMPGQVNAEGFYEAQWGYLLDSNPDYVTNVSELYDQNGDLAWVRTQQQACEKALDWIIRRDSDGDGLVEMMTDSMQQKRGSDWIDIVWASYENAFVNAKLYRALILWSAIEDQLSNDEKAKSYKTFAAKLKVSFNKPTSSGGFWDTKQNCYVHWLDKNGSAHGNNMVTPVNFMAIAYEICTDKTRINRILGSIEQQMVKEQLFFWPLCLSSYAPGEARDYQYPFPEYENGDIFLSWGSVAVKAYASYKPEIALKYVKNVLAQYAKDGLAFQRYGRKAQDGRGDDILSGNALSIVGLYQAIYGVNPLYNRFYLDPHITKELLGTKLKYKYRDQQLLIELNADHHAVSTKQYKVSARTDFGFFSTDHELLYFNKKAKESSMTVATRVNEPLDLEIREFGPKEVLFRQSSKKPSASSLIYQVCELVKNTDYNITVNGKLFRKIRSNAIGILAFPVMISETGDEIRIAFAK